MMATLNQHQRKMHSRTRGTSIGRRLGCAPIPVADKYQGRLRVLPVGKSRVAYARCLTASPVTTSGGIAISPDNGIRFALLRPLRGSSERRLVWSPPCGRAAALQSVRAVMAARRQFCLPKHLDCQVMYVPERHRCLSKVVSFNADRHSERHNGTILYHAGEIPKRNGAPQHECG
jgi:hypothetical protein